MIVGSFMLQQERFIIGVPIGILTSVFMAMYCPKRIYRPLKAATEFLAGIPSVVYGFSDLSFWFRQCVISENIYTCMADSGKAGERKQYSDRFDPYLA